jgi:LDH2 family malate/lactate/ureidoglycolate dehydrogenase
MRIDAFMPANEFKTRMDTWIKTMRAAPPAAGHHRVLIPGDPEREHELRAAHEGISLLPQVVADMEMIAHKAGINFIL